MQHVQNYLGIGLGFIRIVFVPLVVMHCDNEMLRVGLRRRMV